MKIWIKIDTEKPLLIQVEKQLAKSNKRLNMIRVYFETPNHSHSEQVATFEDDKLYIICLPALKREAKRQRMIVTESEL